MYVTKKNNLPKEFENLIRKKLKLNYQLVYLNNKTICELNSF